MSRLDNALKTINKLIQNGMDYSQAEWEASQKHRVSAEKLKKTYDDQTRELLQVRVEPVQANLPEYNAKEWDSYMQFACFYNID